ncbi:PREDICTED: cholinesterase 1-like, partial [Rhagoletis zephyria]|uniref:cholinesterase 1-like n=1 Tax=Rhagoletis zephyria TaxID=28612 RepID=UPI00081184A7
SLSACSADDVQVNSPKGQFVGEGLTVDGRTVFRFLGIPYAKPPIGPLRFARPQPADSVGGDNYQAKQWPPICVQNTKSPMAGNSAHMGKAKNMSEDCLYLNVWSPAELKLGSTLNSDQLKPVIVWIHGGGLVIGTSSFDLYDGEMLAAKADAIVVTFNYRVSTLGFLYSDDVAAADVKGNQGFWDQNQALKWVKANIGAFGGRADQVTVMGESAGGWSVSAHILSPASRGLFQRAILQSGALTSFPMITEPAVHVRRLLTGIRSVTGCATQADTSITASVVECLRRLPAKKVDELFYQIEQDPFEPLVPVAVIDGEFITEKPEKMLSSGSYQKNISLLVSTVEDEGSFVIAMYGGAVPGLKATDPAPYSLAEAETFLPDLLSKHIFTGANGYPLVNASSSEDIKKTYFSGFSAGNASQADEWRKRVGVAFGDLAIGCPTLNFAREVFKGAASTTAKVYQWYFNSKLGAEKFICHPWAGACHCNELYGVFGMPFRYPEQYLEREREISGEVIGFIGAFIRTGTPGPQHSEWLPYSMAEGGKLVAPYYEINNGPKVPANFKVNLKSQECDQVWKRYYNNN